MFLEPVGLRRGVCSGIGRNALSLIQAEKRPNVRLEPESGCNRASGEDQQAYEKPISPEGLIRSDDGARLNRRYTARGGKSFLFPPLEGPAQVLLRTIGV